MYIKSVGFENQYRIKICLFYLMFDSNCIKMYDFIITFVANSLYILGCISLKLCTTS